MSSRTYNRLTCFPALYLSHFSVCYPESQRLVAVNFLVFFFHFLGGSAVQQSDEEEPHMNFARSSANRKRTIESMIVVEKVMTKFYGVGQIKKYVPTIVNVVW